MLHGLRALTPHQHLASSGLQVPCSLQPGAQSSAAALPVATTSTTSSTSHRHRTWFIHPIASAATYVPFGVATGILRARKDLS